MGGSPNGHAPPHDFDLSTVIAYKRYNGASVVVLGEDKWRKGSQYLYTSVNLHIPCACYLQSFLTMPNFALLSTPEALLRKVLEDTCPKELCQGTRH